MGLLTATLLVLISAAKADDEFEPCTIKDGDNFYDLNPLKSK